MVRDGIITGCKIGIDVSDSTESAFLVDRVLTVSNSGGGMSLGNSGNAVLHSVSNNNGRGGIFLGCPANVLDTTALGNLVDPNISAGSACDLFNALAP